MTKFADTVMDEVRMGMDEVDAAVAEVERAWREFVPRQSTGTSRAEAARREREISALRAEFALREERLSGILHLVLIGVGTVVLAFGLWRIAA